MARMRGEGLPLLVLDHTAIPLGHLSPELSTTSSEVAGPSADVEVASSRPSSQSHAPTSPADPASDADSPDYHQILRERRAANRAHGIDLDRPHHAQPSGTPSTDGGLVGETAKLVPLSMVLLLWVPRFRRGNMWP